MSFPQSVFLANPSTALYIQASARGYFRAGMLDRYFTTFMDHPDYALSKWMKRVLPPFEREIARRRIDGLPMEALQNFPIPELIRTFSSRYAGPRVTDFIWEKAETAFDRRAASLLRDHHRWVHVYEHAALATLQKAKKMGVLSLYEQPSQNNAFFTRIVEEQFRKYPELKTGALTLLNDEKAQRRNQRRDQELQTADFIRCNSTFTKKTLTAAGIPPEKISVIPLGFPKPVEFKRKPEKDKVIFLNAGNQNLRKALHLLYAAWRQCNFAPEQAELWLIGKMGLPEHLRKGLPGKVVIRDSIPRDELMDLYRQVDVFVLPTLADGFGMVISEAMSRGVPVITTENSGGPDVILHEYNGMIIPAGDQDALAAQLRWCVENKHRLPEMGYQAWEKAKSWQWEDFEDAVAAFARERILEKQETSKK